ncbi:hypothetical protein [Acidiphilium acidophilum]|uniref:beta strand repeat-containing protein n=1 Tax=Acidiphilium acidophilum TaxID=76588 RepID=UPI002E8E703B|nr:hypothetical protein [Acidiphilium acidophilum]
MTATLDITANAGGTTGTQQVNIGAEVATALAKGTATMWLDGSLAQEAIVSIPVTGSLRIEADVTAYANGKISADLQFNNDTAMSAAGGTITYSTTITQNGVVVSSQPSLTQYQYQDWSTTVGTAPPAGALNIQENIPYLEATGAVQNYDTQYGAASTQISGEAAAIAAPGWNAPLGTDGITQYMPEVGGRGDIGPTTQSNADWLITQNATAAAYALGQAQEAGSVPWHFYDPTTNGAFLNTADIPGIWTDPRGNPGLTQQVSSASGWRTDPAHMPDLSFDAYLQTGNVQYLEQLNAQASFAETNAYPPSNTRNDGQGLVVHGQQIRASAWALRELQEAAYANPAGSADKAYFTQMVNTNYSWLVSMIPTWTTEEGQAYGYLPGSYGSSGNLPPWQEDYFASSVIQGAEMGNQSAVTYLAWSSNFLVGRFFADAAGFNPKDGIAYNLRVVTGTNNGLNSGAPLYTTWAGIEQATEAAGGSNVAGSGMGSGWGQSQGDYGALALQTLAGVITVSTMNAANAATMGVYQYQAMQAFGWLLASGAPYISPNLTASTTPQFSIDPRLANGQLLSFGNVTISTDTTPTVLTPVDSTENALIYAGSGADTLVGGKGINLLFGGSGSDVIFGGPNGNDIFAGSGNETIVAGGGANYIQASSTALLTAGTGKDLFVIDTQASGTVTISGFNAALDRLDLVDASGGALSGLVSTVVTGAQTVAGGVVLKVSPTETVTIETVNGATVSASWFSEQNQALTVSGASSGGLTGGGSSSQGGNSPGVGSSTIGGSSGAPAPIGTSTPLNPQSLLVTSGSSQTVLGGSGGLVDSISGATVNENAIVSTETVSVAGSYDTISAYGHAGSTASNGKTFLSGTGDYVTVNGGSVVDFGTKNTIVSSYNFGSLSIDEIGTGGVLSVTGGNENITVGGNDNVASLNMASTATVNGTGDTVTASTYTQVNVTHANNIINVSGESAASITGGDSLIASGFDHVVASGNNFISIIGGSGVMPTINAGSGVDTVSLGADSHVSLSGAGSAVVVVSSATAGSSTVAGYNPATDKISLVDSNGQGLTSAQIAEVVAGASSSNGTTRFNLGNGASLVLTDLTSAPQVGWFAPPQPASTTSSSNYIVQSGNNQTILATPTDPLIVDPVNNMNIDARRMGQTETLTMSGSGNAVDAQGEAGGFATYGNIDIAGAANQITVTGGTLAVTGNGDSIVSPYNFGSLTVDQDGTNGFATIIGTANTSVGGSGNLAIVDMQTAHVTVGGTNNTVTASVYTPVDMTGFGDRLNLSGNAGVTVSGIVSSSVAVDTIQATGFNTIVTDGGQNLISIPGGSWNSTVSAVAGSDTVVAGPAAPGGSNGLTIIGDQATLNVIDNNSGRTITMSAGTGAVTATGAANGSLFIGGSSGGNYLAATGNSTLVGNGLSDTLVGGGGNEVLAASTVTGASNIFIFSTASVAGNDTISGFGLNGSNDQIRLSSGLNITSETSTLDASNVKMVVINLNDGSHISLIGFSGSLQQTANGGTLYPGSS